VVSMRKVVASVRKVVAGMREEVDINLHLTEKNQ
jgi:hypothetical protein